MYSNDLRVESICEEKQNLLSQRKIPAIHEALFGLQLVDTWTISDAEKEEREREKERGERRGRPVSTVSKIQKL